MVLPVLRFNFASPQGEPRTQGELIRAALELAQWGESRGILTVSIDEHHATGQGWSCNPITGRRDVSGADEDADRQRGLRAGAAVESGPARRRHRLGRQHESRSTAHHGGPGLPHGRI